MLVLVGTTVFTEGAKATKMPHQKTKANDDLYAVDLWGQLNDTVAGLIFCTYTDIVRRAAWGVHIPMKEFEHKL